MEQATRVARGKRKLPLVPVLVALIFIVGAGVFLFPTVSNYFAEKNCSRISDEYESAVYKLNEDILVREKQRATEYNEALLGDPVRDPFLEGSGMALPPDYLDVLNVSGAMATIEIPKIQVKLPIYHGTSKAVLDAGVGHVQQTALPIGGVGSHSVLTAHTGHSRAMLFTDLDKLVLGDIFIIYVLTETLYYEVDDITVIVPDEISMLEPIEGKDCITLVTCTPYGVNSHRLLVRGVRTQGGAAPQETGVQTGMRLKDKLRPYIPLAVVPLLVLLMAAVYFLDDFLRKAKKRKLLAASAPDDNEDEAAPAEVTYCRVF